MLHPEAEKGGRGKKSAATKAAETSGFSERRVQQARTVLAFSRELAPAVRDGTKTLDAALAEAEIPFNLKQSPTNAPAPIVPVRRDGRTLIVNRCPFCLRSHRHGDAGRTARGSHGHRLAHCRQPPRPDAGYLLVECAEPIVWLKTSDPPCW